MKIKKLSDFCTIDQIVDHTDINIDYEKLCYIPFLGYTKIDFDLLQNNFDLITVEENGVGGCLNINGTKIHILGTKWEDIKRWGELYGYY